jgi:hypothetical protein
MSENIEVTAPSSTSKSGKNILAGKRRSTRASKASEKALVNLAQEKSDDQRKQNKKTGPKSQKRVHFDAEQLVPALDVAKETPKKKGKSSDPQVIQEIVAKVCTDVVPEIVSSLINQRQQRYANERNVDQEDEGEDGSNSDGDDSASDNEEHLRSLALQSVTRPRTPHSTFGSTSTLPADLLPAVDGKVIRKVKRGEFVDLTLCLPNFRPHERLPVVTPTLNEYGDPSWKVSSSSPRGKIRSFSDWLVAWNNYFRCVTYFFPELARQLFFHQSEITNMERMFTFESVMIYDQTFRTRIATKEILRWDFHDNEVRSAWLIPRPRQSTSTSPRSEVICWSCGQSGHLSTRCPRASIRESRAFEQDVSRPPFLAPQRPTGTSTTSSNYTPRSATIPRLRGSSACLYWNSERGCSYQNCRFDHRCDICRSRDHNSVHCPGRHDGH